MDFKIVEFRIQIARERERDILFVTTRVDHLSEKPLFKRGCIELINHVR